MLALNIGQNYPNPANQNVIIPVSNLLHDATLQVTDFTGRVVLEKLLTNKALKKTEHAKFKCFYIHTA
jgi:hypothetical protein